MIKLNINRLERRQTQRIPLENDLSSVLVAKSSVRNQSQSTKSAGVKSSSKPPLKRVSTNVMPYLDVIDDKGTSTRTMSQQDQNELPLIEKKLSENNVSNPISQRRRLSRKLIHIQTSPNGFDRKPSLDQTNYQVVQYQQLEIEMDIGEPQVLYKGYRNITGFNSVSVISYNLLFGQWKMYFFSNDNTELNKVATTKQILTKLKQESILVLLLNPKQRLSSLQSHIIEQFDCIMSNPGIQTKEQLSYQRNQNNLWIKLSSIQQNLKHNIAINKYLFIDSINMEFTSSEVKSINKQYFIQKICHVNNDSAQVLHLYLHADKPNLSKLYNTLATYFKSNLLPSSAVKLEMKPTVDESVIEQQQLEHKLKTFQLIDETKQRVRTQHKKLQQLPIPTPESRAEKMRDQMILHIKSMSQNQKINNMYFNVGDTIMRNIGFFRSHETDKFYCQPRHQELVECIDRLCKRQLPNFVQIGTQSNYAFYYLN